MHVDIQLFRKCQNVEINSFNKFRLIYSQYVPNASSDNVKILLSYMYLKVRNMPWASCKYAYILVYSGVFRYVFRCISVYSGIFWCIPVLSRTIVGSRSRISGLLHKRQLTAAEQLIQLCSFCDLLYTAEILLLRLSTFSMEQYRCMTAV